MPLALTFRRVLTLDASTARIGAGLVIDGALAGCRDAAGDLAALPALAAALLDGAGGPIDLVAVTIGPGGFTGLRSSIALAHGIGLAAGVPVAGVTVGAALAWGKEKPYWAAIDNKRGRVLLERDGRVEAFALESLPLPSGPISLGGDAAQAAGEALAMRGAAIRLDPATAPGPPGIAGVAVSTPIRPAAPLYVEPPAASPGPARRPAPV